MGTTTEQEVRALRARITELEAQREDLLRREQELQEFMESAAIGRHWVAADGTILWANAAELKLLGYARDEYIGRNITEFHIDQAAIREILNRLREYGQLASYEARLRCKDGSVRIVSVNSNVYWEGGRFVHTQSFTRDITDQNRAGELQQTLAAIVESSDDAIISKDLNGIIQSWNRGAERIFGYTAEEVIGKHISMLAVRERIDEIPEILGRIRRGERIDHFQTQRRTKDGRVLSISATISPVRDSSGEIIGASKVARDVTEAKRSEETLRNLNASLVRSNADLEHFAYSASHDLREPVRMVIAYCQLLEKKFGEKLGAGGAEYIRYAVEGARRMDQLLKDLLAFTRASTLEHKPAQEVNVNESIKRVLANLQATINETGAEITTGSLPSVRMHQFQMDQLFQNLIGNAIRYRGQSPPRVHISAERCEDRWLFAVRDNGIGIEPQYREQIFEIFKRLNSAAEYPGSGVGLALCQRIIQRSGGRIWVESEPGHGSTFFFTVPG